MSTRLLSSTVNRATVIAPAGTRWRVIVGTGEIAAPTPPPGACAHVTSPDQARHVVLRDTFDNVSKGEGVTVWTGTGEAPNTAATWDDGGDQGEYAAHRQVSTFQLDAQAYCLAGWRIEYAPATAVEAARASGSAPVDVFVANEETAAGPGVHTADFDLPDRGHYVVRAILDWQMDDGTIAREVRLWRLWTDAMEYYPDVTHPDPTVPCGTPDLGAGAPPALTLFQGEQQLAAGTYMGGRWNDVLVPGASAVPDDSVDLTTGVGLQLRTARDVCVMAWLVSYGPVPAATDGFEATGEPLALQGNPSRDPAYARENRISLGDLPPGDWIVQADVAFPDGSSRTWLRVHVGE